MQPVISLRNVCKFYGQRPVLRDVCLELGEGALVLLVGANGSGKSTLLRILAGLSAPSKGEARRRADASPAYLGHAIFMYPELTARENLAFWGKFYGAKAGDLDKALERTGLLNHGDTPVRLFSRGMAQRLNFARVLLGRPRLILLDEPLTGMDSEYSRRMRAEILALKNKGAAIVMVSHDLANDAALADAVYAIAGRRLTRQPQAGPAECSSSAA